MTFREAISLSFFLLLFFFLHFNYELRGVIGRALASHAIDPGSNPGHAMYILFSSFKRSARFKRNFRHNCMPVRGLA